MKARYRGPDNTSQGILGAMEASGIGILAKKSQRSTRLRSTRRALCAEQKSRDRIDVAKGPGSMAFLITVVSSHN